MLGGKVVAQYSYSTYIWVQIHNAAPEHVLECSKPIAFEFIVVDYDKGDP